VLLDTAGRYTTQSSNRDVDSNAWLGFLGLLKKFRAGTWAPADPEVADGRGDRGDYGPHGPRPGPGPGDRAPAGGGAGLPDGAGPAAATDQPGGFDTTPLDPERLAELKAAAVARVRAKQARRC
jgi:hypothetical protein